MYVASFIFGDRTTEARIVGPRAIAIGACLTALIAVAAAAPEAAGAASSPGVASGPTVPQPATPMPAAGVASTASTTRIPETPSLPTYRTVAPPSFRHVYDLRKGMLSGRGALAVQIDAKRYEARLEGTVLGFRVLDLVSSGHLDGAGFAPDRYVDARRGRAARTADFQRPTGDVGRIAYSGSATVQPLPAGSQDRLSWMLQLAAVTAAKPPASGARFEMFVSGARGDAGIWSFLVVDRPTLRIRGESVQTLHLVRESRHEGDSHAEIWLDPARHHLPVRALWGPDRPGEEPLELLLEESGPP